MDHCNDVEGHFRISFMDFRRLALISFASFLFCSAPAYPSTFDFDRNEFPGGICDVCPALYMPSPLFPVGFPPVFTPFPFVPPPPFISPPSLPFVLPRHPWFLNPTVSGNPFSGPVNVMAGFLWPPSEADHLSFHSSVGGLPIGDN